MDATEENYESEENFYNNFQYAIFIPILVICVFGAVGNGVVIWLLGFHSKRTPFITYILNLAIADFGVLLSTPFLICNVWIDFNPIIFLIVINSGWLTYTSSRFLLTAISIDRCGAVFFPLWHKFRRPPHLSAIVCALIWALSFLLTSLLFTLAHIFPAQQLLQKFNHCMASAVLCLPLMTAATLALLVRLCLRARQHQRAKLLTVIMVTLLFYLLLAFPYDVIIVLVVFDYIPFHIAVYTSVLHCLNSGVNPVIYFLVGRQRQASHRESINIVLQRGFSTRKKAVLKKAQTKPRYDAISEPKSSSFVAGRFHFSFLC